MSTKAQGQIESPNSTKPVLAEVTAEMRSFAEEYVLWHLTFGQKYTNALSPDFTMKSPMDIFIADYYSKDWTSNFR